VARDDPALRVDDEHVRLVVGAELAGADALGIGDGRPTPAVPLDECSAFVGSVGDVEAEKRELGMIPLELCVGDRLALTGASPRRPDVYKHLLPVEGSQGGPLPVERRSLDRRRCRAHGCVLGSGGLGTRGSRSGCILARTASDDERAERQKQVQRPHRSSVASSSSTPMSFRVS
jgi:hypothetical protein